MLHYEILSRPAVRLPVLLPAGGRRPAATQMVILYLALWSACLPLILYAAYRRNNTALSVLVVAWLYLSLPVLIGILTPNPDNIQLIPVAAP